MAKVKENEAVEVATADSAELSELLTGKNSDYVHAVTRQLMLAGKSDAEVKAVLEEALPRIVEAQKSGTTARALLGTPTDFVSQHVGGAATAKKPGEAREYNKNPWLMWVDNILLIFGVISLINGFMLVIQRGQGQQSYGLTALIVSAIFGGAALMWVYRANMAVEAGQRHFRGYRTVVMVAALLLWIAVTMGSMLLPPAVNPNLTGPVLAITGVAVLAVRYYFHQKLHIQPSTLSLIGQQGDKGTGTKK